MLKKEKKYVFWKYLHHIFQSINLKILVTVIVFYVKLI